MKSFPSLETAEFIAYIADNSPLGIHRAGYNGVASLIRKSSGNNLFVPTFAGLNYETISLAGMPAYRHSSGSIFEPRCESMHFEHIAGDQVILAQPETGHAHVSARIIFRVEEPFYLHQRIELTFHQKFCADQEKSAFRSLWASYMHMPPDRHIYTKIDPRSPELHDWLGLTMQDHGVAEMHLRPLPDDRELEAGEHLDMMKSQQALVISADEEGEETTPGPANLPGRPLSFYYGLCHGPQLFLMMFRPPERFRLAYSPCGAGKEPAWNPAWDYILHLDDARPGETYCWDLCLAVKDYQGRADILNEVNRYLGEFYQTGNY